MANPQFEANFELHPVTEKDEKTGLFYSKIPLFKNASGLGRTKEEAEENLLCSFASLWKHEKQNVINILANEYFPKNQRPNNIDLVSA